MRRRVVAIAAAVVAGLLAVVAFHSPRAGPNAAEPMGRERASDAAPPPILAAPESEAHTRQRNVPDTRDGGATDATSEKQAPRPAVRASLRLDTVDAATGASVPATWNVEFFWSVRRLEPTDQDDEVVRHRLEAWEAGFLPSGAVRPDALAHPTWGSTTPAGSVTVRPPPGYLSPEPPPGMRELSEYLAAGVREAVAVIPLDREALLHLRVLGPDDRPAVGAVVRSVEAAGQRRTASVEDLGPGEFRVRGIPNLPGEPVAIAIDWSGNGAVGEAGEPDVVEIQDVDRPDVTSVVPADLSRPWSIVVRLTGPTGPRILDHNETDNDLPTEESLGVAGDGPTGTARVTVLGWDGRPVAGATVSGRVTDADGVVVVSGLPAGQLEFSTRPDGRYPARATAVVPEGAEVDVVLREPVGAVLDVLVTDEEGNPRPSALLWASVVVFDVVDGVQRLDRFTDARGRRTFARVEPGEVTVHASWGSRHGSANVTLRDRERASLHIVAK